ncbi:MULTISPECIES: hypothetical protein [unclassified Microcoleus]|uniref:hypothetical protein n=1 Tax=unclassified Microcoleus TaxID=2642155 RepID=UPI002FD368B6
MVFQVVFPLEREQAQWRGNTCESAIALKQRTIIEIPGFGVISLKNRCSKLNISAAAAASKILAKKFCARAYNPSQQGFSLLQLAKAKSLLAVVSWS